MVGKRELKAKYAQKYGNVTTLLTLIVALRSDMTGSMANKTYTANYIMLVTKNVF